MASVRLTTLVLPQAPLGAVDGELILDAGGGRIPTPEESALLGVGPGHAERRPTALPYRTQDAYGRALTPVRHRAAVLENERLRATFLLDLGGRLWSLVDRRTGRECLHRGDGIRPANLAIRNAWFAGGVEWNLGVTGHWGLTCEPVLAGTAAAPDGTEVLRMWAHERMLGLTWRIDAHLPGGSDRLYIHPVLANPTAADVPVYWWSNIAVPQSRETRVLVDSAAAFHFGYADALQRVDVPLRDGLDISAPARHPGSADYFFLPATEEAAVHPWIAAVDGQGRGLSQASTARLRGRKLFTWGGDPGGETWQRWLSGEAETARYAEIQAGLAPTQLEHLRLPAGETWRFTESYGPIDLGRRAGAPWEQAVPAAREAAVDAEELDRVHALLTALEDALVTRWPGEAPETEGWGALEVLVGHRAHDPATPFDPAALTAEQQAWHDLARGAAPDPILQRSAQTDPAWRPMLEAAEEGWLRDLLLGHLEHAAGDTARARTLWTRSRDTHPTPDALRALALTAQTPAARAEGLVAAHQLDPARRGVALEALAALLEDDQHDRALHLIEQLPAALRALPRVQYLEARARVRTGDEAGAARLLDQPLVLPDLREGDTGLDVLWAEFQTLRGTDEPLPAHYDFRMATQEASWT